MTDESPTGRVRDGIGDRIRAGRDWLLLRGNRTAVSLGVVGLFLVFFGGLMFANVFPILNHQSMYYVYSGLISGNLTLITVVVSVNQLLLSRELNTPGELQSQISNVVEFRRDVEDAAGRVAPVEPLEFLRLIVEATRQQAQALGGMTSGPTGTDDDPIQNTVETVTGEMDRIDRLLDEHSSSTIDVLSAMLTTNYARQINDLRRAKHESQGDLSDSAEQAIDDLIERLQYIDVARQYFKTVYFKQELSSFSRILLLTGLPAEAIAITTLLLMTVPTSDPFAIANLDVLVPVTIALALAPLAVLAAFILRTATVNMRTAATVPFTAPEQEK